MSSGDHANAAVGADAPQAQRRAGRTRGSHEASGYGGTAAASAGYPQAQAGGVARIGFSILAATLMIMGGLWSFFTGLEAIIKHQFFIVTPNYAFKINITTWGWIHLVLGILVFAAGCCLLTGRAWARIVGLALAVLSGLANFLFIPYYPFWAIVIIALDVAIIWALATGLRPQDY